MQTQVTELTLRRDASKKKGPDPEALRLFGAFLDRLRAVRILDPACGSGNFLYIALGALKDLELEAIQWGSLVLRIPEQFPGVGPEAVRGIEINPYAAELARVTIWIGEIQWMLNHGFAYRRNPVLSVLDSIATMDALLDLSDPTNPREAEWPAAEFIVGNPPVPRTQVSARPVGRRLRQRAFRGLRRSRPARGRPRSLLARKGAGVHRREPDPTGRPSGHAEHPWRCEPASSTTHLGLG